MSRRREPQFDGTVANDRNEIAPPHRSSLRSRRHSNTSPNGSVLCVTAKLPGHVRVGSIATEMGSPPHVCFPPDSDQTADIWACLKGANKRHRSRMAVQSAGIVN